MPSLIFPERRLYVRVKYVIVNERIGDLAPFQIVARPHRLYEK
jgi:hypothetical protein